MDRRKSGILTLAVLAAGALALGAAGEVLGDVGRPTSAAPSMGVVVDLSQRQLDIRIDGKLEGTYQVAVGKPGHRTPTGEYHLTRVVWNPGWVPPDKKWAKGADTVPPGAPERESPMGKVKAYFSDLLYIHGTPKTQSLGEPESHGCIRMRNQDAVHLAKLVMEHGGAHHTDAWYRKAEQNDDSSQEVDIPDPPVLRVSR